MKKYIQNIWVRLLACLMCVLSVLGLAVGVLGTMYFAGAPDKEQEIKQGYDKLMYNYALYAIDHLHLLEENQLLENTNLYMTIEKYEYLSDATMEPVITKYFSNMPEGIAPNYKLTELYATSETHYSTKSLLQALNSYHHISSKDYMLPATIKGYAFDVNSGLFYYHTTMGYFKAAYVYVSQDGLSYDYDLTVKNGKEVYYNGYYGISLDTSQYRDWDWVKLSEKKMGITEEYQGNAVQIISDSSIIEAELCTMNYYVDSYHVYYVSDKVPVYRVSMALADTLEKQDLFMEYRNLMDYIYGFHGNLSSLLCISLLGLIVGLVLLTVSAPEQKEVLRFFHKIPLGIFTGGVVLLELGIVFVIAQYVSLFLYQESWAITVSGFVIPLLLLVCLVLLVFFTYLANVITRIKTKCFWRYSELYYVSRPVVLVVQLAKENLSLFWKGAGILFIIAGVEFLLLCFNQYETDNLWVLFLLEKIIEIPLILYVLIQMKKLQDGAKQVASGDLSKPIDTTNMVWEFKKHAESINQVSDGIAIAVEEQMKSERFKTELITNVSHDIKTPLTSIINYVDLIKKEEITDSTMIEYVDVLDRQSARLKKLIEDLMEASKASTGNLEVNLEECDMGVLLTQVVGEFEDKLAASGLEAVVSKPEEPVKIMADGRHIWRVLDNLMNNVCKYSQENTRVYVSLEEQGDKVQIVFKNISKTALNIPSDQLMQRFVRGDSSRHTEGSGLGLSIAQSLTELMNGTMKLDIDGDLFKVILKFDRIA
ncbi:MAG: HAMP domain-containing histidine kinase [Agathobacter sp.]|nr:HAMP domain-containing histidine kinase [Agathobacter sp.]